MIIPSSSPIIKPHGWERPLEVEECLAMLGMKNVIARLEGYRTDGTGVEFWRRVARKKTATFHKK